jgi:hypothetical protein
MRVCREVSAVSFRDILVVFVGIVKLCYYYYYYYISMIIIILLWN